MVISFLRHEGSGTFNTHIRSSFVGERTHISCTFSMNAYHILIGFRNRHIRYLQLHERLNSIDCLCNGTFGTVGDLLTYNFAIVFDTIKYIATITIEKSTQRFHRAI